MKKISSLNLYPHTLSSILRDQGMKIKLLNLTKFFIDQSINAINSFFIKKTYADFDAHVGDTLCQIRAYKLLLMIKNFNENPSEINYHYEINELMSAKKNIESKICSFQELLENKKDKYNVILDKHETLEEFIKHHDLEFEINEATLYLSQCIILTKYSKRVLFGVSIAMKYQTLAESIGAGESTARKLIKKFQLNLAQDSTSFIYSIAEELAEFRLSETLHKLELADTHNRKILPCYEATKTILLHMKKSKIPILLIAYTQTNETLTNPQVFLFQFSEKTKKFEQLSSNQLEDKNTACFVVHGSTTLEQISSRLIDPIEIIILANMATHPQNRLPITSDRENELISMELLAKEQGYCKENSTLFFLKHIYSDLLESELARLHNYSNRIQETAE